MSATSASGPAPTTADAAKAASRARTAMLAGDVVLNAGITGTQAAATGDDPLASARKGAAVGAGTALAGGAVGKAVGTLARGLHPGSDLAQSLVKDGVPLTPGQYGNGAARWVENRLAAMPIVGEKIAKRQMEAFDPWNREVLRRITAASGVGENNAARAVTAGGHAGFRQADDVIGKLYDDLDATQLVLNGTETTGAVVRQTIRDFKDQILMARRAGQPANAAAIERELANYRAGLPERFTDALNKLDRANADLLTVGRTAKYKGPRHSKGVFTPAELPQAVAARSKGNTLARGENALANSAEAAQSVIGKSNPTFAERIVNPLLGVGAAGTAPVASTAAGVAAIPFATKTGGKWARGALPGQQAIRQAEAELSKRGLRGSTLANALREYLYGTDDEG